MDTQTMNAPGSATTTTPTTTTPAVARTCVGPDTGKQEGRVTAMKNSMKDKMSGQWNWNKIGIGAGAAAAVAGAAIAARKYHSSDEASKDDFQLRLETDENLRLISSKKVEGTPVMDREGAKIGTVDNFMVDKYTGRVAYAVMRFGGTFGLGASLFPLPWPLLDYDEEMGGYRLEITKDEMKEAPRFEENQEPEFSPEYRRRIILFYRPGTV